MRKHPAHDIAQRATLLMNAKPYLMERTTAAGRLATAGHVVRLLAAVLVASMLPCVGTVVVAETPALSEYQVKALFLFNFAKYVDWPSRAFSDDSAPIVIGLAGQDNFGENFKQVINAKTVSGRPVVVKHVANADEYKNCHILFISASENERLREILNAVKDAPVLTVGETDQFLSHDGMINLAKKANKIRLEINLLATQRAQLKLSSKLLSVADVVTGKSGG